MISDWLGLTSGSEKYINRAQKTLEKSLYKSKTRKIEQRQINDISYQLIRSEKRNTIGLQVKSGVVVVRAPYYVCETLINKFIIQKIAWINEKLSDQTISLKDEPKSMFRQDGSIFVLGELKRINVVFTQTNNIEVENSFLVVELSNKYEKLSPEALSLKIKGMIEFWLKQQCENYLTLNIPLLSEKCQLFPKSYQIKRYKARWGSCNIKKELSFNYLLMMCPVWVIDYVIIHELCHIEQLNHSKDFWSLVEKYCPDHKKAKVWFSTHKNVLLWR